MTSSKLFIRYTELLLTFSFLFMAAGCGGGSTPTSAGSLTLSTSSLTYSFTSGSQTQPASQAITVTNSGGAVPISATTDQAWLTVNPTTGNTPVTLTVSVLPNGLGAQTYTGHVTVKSSNSTAVATVAFTVSAALPAVEQHADLRRKVVYQIVTDRFFDGDSINNSLFPSLFDASQSNWQLYWGGDLAGIQAKLTYLKTLGVGAIWISPPVDNVNSAANYNSALYAPYHGYWARDDKRIEEHFGDSNNSWAAFDNLVAAAHAQGIQIIVDFAPNHTNPRNAAEYGVLYDDGIKVTDYASDTASPLYYHHTPNISNWNDRYQLQYYTLSDLADFNQENPAVDQYVKDSLTLFLRHGADGFRLDAIKHAAWGWEYTLANSAATQYALELQKSTPTDPSTGVAAQPPFLFGEWMEGLADSLYVDSVKFANNSGIALLDYPLYWDVASAFATGGSFNTVDNDVVKESGDFATPNDLVTFVDNHDNPRLLSQGATQSQLNEALAFLMTSRGIPVVYYGDEQGLHNDTSNGSQNGGDPYTRVQFPIDSFNPASTGANVVRYLAALRSKNVALAYGTMQQRWKNDDVYVFERAFNDSVVLVAINKNKISTQVLSGPWATALPAGNYTDYMNGLLGGVPLTVLSGGSVANGAVTLPASSVSVWQFQAETSAPAIGAVTPNVGQPGVIAAAYGLGFGSTQGTVQLDNTATAVLSWADDVVTFKIPNIAAGRHSITVTPISASAATAPTLFRVLNAAQVPVTFVVQNANPASGEQIYLTGDVVELGANSTSTSEAIGPLLVAPSSGLPPLGTTDYFITASVPAGATVNYKFLKLSATGALDSAETTTHSCPIPTSGEPSSPLKVTWNTAGSCSQD